MDPQMDLLRKEKGKQRRKEVRKEEGTREERLATPGWGARGVGHEGSSTGDQAKESQVPGNMWDASPVG